MWNSNCWSVVTADWGVWTRRGTNWWGFGWRITCVRHWERKAKILRRTSTSDDGEPSGRGWTLEKYFKAVDGPEAVVFSSGVRAVSCWIKREERETLWTKANKILGGRRRCCWCRSLKAEEQSLIEKAGQIIAAALPRPALQAQPTWPPQRKQVGGPVFDYLLIFILFLFFWLLFSFS